MQFPKFRRTTLSQQAFESILHQVERGVLRPGDRLPSQRNLCVEMSLSQTAVREALQGLASVGVIEIHAGKGTFVKSVSPELLVCPEALFSILERDTLLQALEVRRILEVEAIGLAARRATSDDLKELEVTLRHMRTGTAPDEEALRHSPSFHLSIAKASHNTVLVNVIKPFLRLMARGAQVIGDEVPGATEREHGLHADLYKAIADRDPEKARQSMRRHLDEAEELIIQGYAAIQNAAAAHTVG